MTIDMAVRRIEEGFDQGLYTAERAQEKIAAKKQEQTNIETEIQKIEEQLRVASDIDIHVKKLQEAAQQVNYRIQHYTRAQQKIFCQLFVDRIEMYREKKGKIYNVHAKVLMRFNPDQFNLPENLGRTGTALQDNTKIDNHSNDGLRGALDQT